MPNMQIQSDDLAWEESERLERLWRDSLFVEETQRAIGDFIKKHRRGVPEEVGPLQAGGFNTLFRLTFLDGGVGLMRFAKPGFSMFPEEKTRSEVATMRYVQDNTAIPVPFVLHWGTKEESPVNIGAFIVMDHVSHEKSMCEAMNTPGFTADKSPILDPDIDEGKLGELYGQAANVLLQLSKLEFPRIGALEETGEWEWDVTQRPLSLPINELVRTGTLPRGKLPTGTFSTTSSYLEMLAQLHVDHLTHQRNDAIASRQDCQRKYVARHLFLQLTRGRKLPSSSTNSTNDSGPFKFWCDDLRPSNILLNANLEIAAVIDWEFSYAAPVEFTHAPPWWLLIEKPEYWPAGLDDWTVQYEKRLCTFLKAMVGVEDVAIADGRLGEEQRLSGKMRSSWDSGGFWSVYAARSSSGFDEVYWRKLDRRFFGEVEDVAVEDLWKHRVKLLDDDAREAMEVFVDKKVKESETRELRWEPDET